MNSKTYDPRVSYLKNIRHAITNDNKKESYDKALAYLIKLAKKGEPCHSKIVIEWVLIQRKVRKIQPANTMLTLISELEIKRPSFKLLAKMITTYCNSVHDDKSFTEDVKTTYTAFRYQYKYYLNTYLLNYILNTYNKIDDKDAFWDLVAQSLPEDENPMFDLYTFGSIFEMCIKEENWDKMSLMKKKFDKVSDLLFDTNNKNYHYVKSLYNRSIKVQQKRQYNEYLDWLSIRNYNLIYV
jgi:hypothetical protein